MARSDQTVDERELPERVETRRYDDSWWESGAFLLVLLASVGYLLFQFPAPEDYRLAADEGMYYRQALTVVDEGPHGFVTLADDYIRAGLAGTPSPLRIGHILPAAAFVAVRRSIVALSAFSLTCHALLCIVVFWFVRRLWDRRTGLIAAVFAAVSPLGAGLARRALMDTDVALFSALSLFAFLMWLQSERERHFAIFAGALTWSALVKETAFLYLPFYATALFALKLTGRTFLRTRHVVLISLAVPAAIAFVYVVLLGGIGRVLQVIEVAFRSNVTSPNAYAAAYSSGPWYEYFVDYFLLSPLVVILFLLFCGRYVSAPPHDVNTTLALLFFCYAFAFLTFLPKNPRYALPLDAMLRLGAALLIVSVAAKLRSGAATRAAAVAGLVALVVVTDVRAFHRYFAIGGIYDPIAFNLLAAEKMIPTTSDAALRPLVDAKAPPASASEQPTAEEYLARSMTAYQGGDYITCIQMCRLALALKPDYAEAYNNMGAAYCALGLWNEAIAALESALRLQPDLSLARNNLAWAQAELRKQTR